MLLLRCCCVVVVVLLLLFVAVVGGSVVVVVCLLLLSLLFSFLLLLFNYLVCTLDLVSIFRNVTFDVDFVGLILHLITNILGIIYKEKIFDSLSG